MSKPNDQLKQEIIDLGPWHLKVQVSPEVDTSAFLEAQRSYPPDLGVVSFLDDSALDAFRQNVSRLYPQGFEGKRFLDCACNCGAYCLWAKELGAAECFGFDVRNHWIDQANFLKVNREQDSTGVRFEVCNLYDLGNYALPKFDLTLFKGIFYHLAEPMGGLKLAADLTEDVIIVNTVTRNGMPDGYMWATTEDTAHLMAGVDDLIWQPTGPETLQRILSWLGFRDFKVNYWDNSDGAMGRMEVMAARTPNRFSAP